MLKFWIYQSRTSGMSRWFVIAIARRRLLNPRHYAKVLDLPIQNEQYEPAVIARRGLLNPRHTAMQYYKKVQKE